MLSFPPKSEAKINYNQFQNYTDAANEHNRCRAMLHFLNNFK